MFAAFASLNHRGRQSRRKPAGWIALWIALMIIVVLVATPSAQQLQTAFNAVPPAATSEALPSPTDVSLLVGRSTILNVGATIARVSLTVPDIADAMVTAPSQILIHGKQPGTISLFVWDKAGAIKTFEVTVRRDLSALKEQLSQLFPGETIAVHGSGKDVVLSGTVSGQYAIEKAAEVAAGYVDKKENVVNLLKQQEGIASNQVMLRVRFAEVSRSAMMELGAAWFTGPGGYRDYVARITSQQFPAPNFDPMERSSIQGVDNWGGGRDTVDATGGKQTFSDFLNIFLFNNKYNIGTVIRALSDKGLFQSLAEPNLIATNGKEASFLAGGEYPYPVVQPGASGTSVSIVFKEFGIRLRFTPTVLGGDLVNLKVEPEVSALDFTNAIVLQGFRIPALSTRRTQTEVELRDGQTFAIAGLLNNTVTDTMRKIPGIGDIPILGWLFKSKAMQKNQTELVVMITPTIIRKGSMGVSEGLPSPVVPFLGAPEHRLPPQAPYTGSPRYPANDPQPRDTNMTDASQPAAAPANAAATRPAANAPVNGVSTPVPGSNASAPAARKPASPAPAPTSAPATKTPDVKTTPAVTPVAATPPPAAAPRPAAPSKPTKEEIKAQKRAEENAAKQRAADEKRRQEAERVAAQRAAEEKVQADKLAKERAKREGEVAKTNEELARKKAIEDAKKEKAIAEAAARLKQAQAAYEAEMAKVKSGGGMK
jgi:pilus assembly protein CpaC